MGVTRRNSIRNEVIREKVYKESALNYTKKATFKIVSPPEENAINSYHTGYIQEGNRTQFRPTARWRDNITDILHTIQ